MVNVSLLKEDGLVAVAQPNVIFTGVIERLCPGPK